MTTIIRTILAAAMLVALTAGAEAKKRHHRHHHSVGSGCPVNTICYPGKRLPLMLGIGV